VTVHILDREFTAKDVQEILRTLTGGNEKIGLALLNYYARTNLVPTTGKSKSRGRPKYAYADLLLLCWLFRMKREGLPVSPTRRPLGIAIPAPESTLDVRADQEDISGCKRFRRICPPPSFGASGCWRSSTERLRAAYRAHVPAATWRRSCLRPEI
jgi:hypothetical protein